MRSVVFRYDDVSALADALSGTTGALPLPAGETVGDGEWVLAIFEIGSKKRATAAAARGVRAAGDTHLAFERRDWERLVGFVMARTGEMRAIKIEGLEGPPSRRMDAPPVSKRFPEAPPVSKRFTEAAPVSKRFVDAPPVSKRLEGPPSKRLEGPPSKRLEGPPSKRLEGPPSQGPRSRRLESLPPSSSLESTRLPFGARVLVVDDSGDELRAMLTEMGLVVELVATTKLAAERMAAQVFEAFVLDLHAPDSRAFVGKVRADARAADVPVLFLSSKPTSRDVVDAFASGADDFLPRPFRAPELAARIFGLLRRARLARTQTYGAGGR